MRSLAWLALLPVFFVDVRVRASSGDPSDGSRASCFKSDRTCALSALNGVIKFKAGEDALGLERGAVVEQRAPDTFQLVQGAAYFDFRGAVTVRAAFGHFACTADCRALIERGTELTLGALSGDWIARRLGDDRVYAVPAGLRVALARVEPSGQGGLEFPQSLPWDATLRSWARLYPGDVESFTRAVRDFRPVWREAVETASRLHADHAGRSLASHARAVARAESRRRAVEAENAELRRLFRSKSSVYH